MKTSPEHKCQKQITFLKHHFIFTCQTTIFNETVEILYKAKSYIFNYFMCVGKYNKYNIFSYCHSLYVFEIFICIIIINYNILYHI